MRRLEGKYAIITGAGGGIGAETAKKFVEEGIAGVAILEYNFEAAQETAAALDPTSRTVIPIACDVSRLDQVEKAVDEVLARFGRVDILVNNAGLTRDRFFHKMTEAQWDEVIGVNLKGVFNTCHVLVPKMRKQQYGRIVNLSSSAIRGTAGQCNYSASKAALIGFCRSLAKESGLKNITVNCVAPGATETDMWNVVPEEIKSAALNRHPMRRFGKPRDIANAIAFLASDEAEYISGQCLLVNGGV